MKKILLFLATSALLSACNQSATLVPSTLLPTTTGNGTAVPTAVASTLQTNYPTATSVNWSKVGVQVYQATFTASNKARIANINATGMLLATYGVIDATTLPKVITDYIAANYAEATVVRAGTKTDVAGAITQYEVVISVSNVQYELEFDAAGKFLLVENEDGSDEGVAVAQASLPAAITTYLGANYAGYTVQSARSYMLNGVLSGYEVWILSNGVATEGTFDATGKFIRVRTGGNGYGDHQEGNYGSTTAVTQASLPATVATYLDATYKGYVFQGAYAYAQNGALAGYEVTVLLNAVYTELRFDATGKFLSVHRGGNGGDGEHDGGGNKGGSSDAVIAQTALPATIATYLTTNYAGYAFVSAKVEQSGTTVTGYEVRFTLAGRSYEAEFNAAGTLIKLH